MYNRYIPGSEQLRREGQTQGNERTSGGTGFFGSGLRQLWDSVHRFEGVTKNAGIAGILKEFGLGELDSGDLLLMLILLLVFLEGDSTELVITLALMLLLGDEDTQKE